MKKIIKWFIVFALCLCFCFPVMASDEYVFDFDVTYEGVSRIYHVQGTSPVYLVSYLAVEGKTHFNSFALFSLSSFEAFPDGLGGLPTFNPVAVEIDGYSVYCSSLSSTDLLPVTAPNQLPDYDDRKISIVRRDILALYKGNQLIAGNGANVNGYSYDSSIPAPKNLTFNTREEGGNFIIAGTKYFGLNWTSPIDSTLMCRIDANVSGKAGTGGVSKVQYVRLADETMESKVLADLGKYEFTANSIEEKIGGNLQRMDYIRLQYYRITDGKITVGPISTVKLHLGLFGKYTYTVTTEYPNDESDVGESGGMDDSYYDKWTSDGENYYEYDQDGNIVDSGTSSGSIVDSFNKLINSLLNIPTIITRLFSSLTEMMSGIGALPAYFAQVVTWLPSEITALISLGIVVVIALRIFGR